MVDSCTKGMSSRLTLLVDSALPVASSHTWKCLPVSVWTVLPLSTFFREAEDILVWIELQRSLSQLATVYCQFNVDVLDTFIALIVYKVPRSVFTIALW